tara:strand:- start:613 stop:951 length:339 start_codon:yes stop_codon:yes gene_type:complete
MPYTFDKTKNILTINSYSGIKIRDIYNYEIAERGIEFNHTGHKWIEGTLCAFDGSVMKRYEVFFSFNHHEHKIIIRVKQPYYDAKFEDIFNLGRHCQYWNINTTIGILEDIA